MTPTKANPYAAACQSANLTIAFFDRAGEALGTTPPEENQRDILSLMAALASLAGQVYAEEPCPNPIAVQLLDAATMRAGAILRELVPDVANG